MARVPSRVAARFIAGLKRFQPILEAARKRDVNESDTVVIVTDILGDLLGYDKYIDITSEHMIRGTFCDLAIHLDTELALLVEVKAIGSDLKEQHVKQAVDYAANKGCEWVALTNGIQWQVYRVVFEKPLDRELVAQVDLLRLNPRKASELEVLWAISKEGWRKSRLSEYAAQQAALNRFSVAAAVLSGSALALLRRELRRMNPGAQVDLDELRNVLLNEVLKREVIDGAKAADARQQLARARSRRVKSPVGGRATHREPSVAPALPHPAG